MKTLKDIKAMKGKKVSRRAIVRVDYNVPMKGNKILDTRRIDASFDTIRTLQKKGVQVQLLAHLGDGTQSLKPISLYLSKYFDVHFVTKPILSQNKVGALIGNPPAGGSKDTVILFENIRRYPEEEKNDLKFAKVLAGLADIYVNDAFSVSHRKHASLIGITKYLPSYAGIQLEKEIKTLSKLLNNKKHPFLFIIGGAKFATKIPLLKRFVETADQIVVAGAILNSFYKTAGFEVGDSVVENGFEKSIKQMLSSPKLLLPVDAVVVRETQKLFLNIDEIQKKDVIVDIGAESIRLISEKIKKSKVIVWTGPNGWYERGFIGATVALAQAIKKSKAFTIIGGGDTAEVIEKVVGENKHIFISTGGGATLDYLADGILPAVQCLK